MIKAAPDMPFVRTAKGLVDITQAEADGFWAWAVVETLRHTGIRVEELLELTQLSLPHYTSPSGVDAEVEDDPVERLAHEGNLVIGHETMPPPSTGHQLPSQPIGHLQWNLCGLYRS